MPRARRKSYGGYLYHVLNRANGRLCFFRKAGDFAAFEAILGQGQERTGRWDWGDSIVPRTGTDGHGPARTGMEGGMRRI